MNIAICDDNPQCRKTITELVNEYITVNADKHISLSVFTHGEDLLDAVSRKGEFDIYILDIVMPGMNGIELGTILRDKGYDGKIIYLTSSEEYAIESFRAKPFNYITKPAEKSALFSTLDEAFQSLKNKNEKFMIVKTKEGNLKIRYDALLFAEISGRCITYYLRGGKKVQSTTLRTTFSEAVQSLLSDNRFTLCGAGRLVNLSHIESVENDAVVFEGNQKLVLGIKIIRELRSAWLDYCFSEEALK